MNETKVFARMNKVEFMHKEPPWGGPIKLSLLLILIAAFPLSSSVIFHITWLVWVGVALIMAACLLIAYHFFRPSPKFRLVRVNTKSMLDEFLRLGWTLREERREPGDNESPEYLLEWLRESDPPPPDMSKLSETSTSLPQAQNGSDPRSVAGNIL
jgi:hypothetical protein